MSSEGSIRSAVATHYVIAQYALARLAFNLRVIEQRVRIGWRREGGDILKRVFDAVASFITLIVLAPLFGLIALLIKLEDGGPALFVQTRVGKFGREFEMYKFRSMSLDAEQRFGDLLDQNEH